MHIIQKTWQTFEEIEAFWCVVGLAKSLPYIFGMKDVMTESLSWSQKMVLLAISTVIEIRYKDLYKAIMRHGLPIEYYLSDKLTTMLSTVFPTETLMRLYDLIALEAASKEPIRAMWVVISGCIMLLKLNETYIRAARSAEEIELVINNTGINHLQTQKLVEEVHKLGTEIFGTYNPMLEALLYVVANVQDSAMGAEYAWTRKARDLDAHYEPVRHLNVQVRNLMGELHKMAQEEAPAAQPSSDSAWVRDFVRRFCTYYQLQQAKEGTLGSYCYVYKVVNVEEVKRVTVLADGSEMGSYEVQKAGLCEALAQITPGAKKLVLRAESSNQEPLLESNVALDELATDMPITLDLVLTASGRGEVPHAKKRPQPFLSLVLYIPSSSEGNMDGNYKPLREALHNETSVIRPEHRAAPPRELLQSIIAVKDKQQQLMKKAGLSTIYTPGMESAAVEPNSHESDKVALKQVLNLIRSEASVHYGDTQPPSASMEVLASRTYDLFAKVFGGRCPLKRLMVSVICTSTLSVNEKLLLFYDLYASITSTGKDSFTIEGLMELVQMLYEIHLVPIAPECVPQIVEHVMTDGGINRITNAYLLTSETDVNAFFEQLQQYSLPLIPF